MYTYTFAKASTYKYMANLHLRLTSNQHPSPQALISNIIDNIPPLLHDSH